MIMTNNGIHLSASLLRSPRCRQAPLKTRKVRSEYPPWLSSNVKREMNHRDYLKRRAVASKCDKKLNI